MESEAFSHEKWPSSVTLSCNCRDSLSEWRLSIKNTIPAVPLVSRVTRRGPSWSSPALWLQAGNPGPQFPRVSRPSWTWRTKTARSVLSPLCLLSPPHPLPRPPHPPPTPCPPQPLAPVRPRYLRPAGWGCSQHRQMLLAAGDGTARSLSLTPPSPSAWMTTASAQQTCNAERSVQTLVWTKVLVPFLSDECDWWW